MKNSIKLAIIGAVVGIPLSYWFQPEKVRQMMSLGDYITSIPKMFSNQVDPFTGRNTGSDAIGNVFLCCLICAAIAGFIGYQMDKKHENESKI